MPVLPSSILLDPLIQQWLAEDVGRGDRTTEAILGNDLRPGRAELRLKQAGRVAGLPLIERVFRAVDGGVTVQYEVQEGADLPSGTSVAYIAGPLSALLTGERVMLNLIMGLSGVATLTQRYVQQIGDLPTQLVDTRKTTPGLRLLEKYAVRVGGAQNHRFGLDDAAMIKENHIVAAGGLGAAVERVRESVPFPLAIEVETESLAQVEEAIAHQVDIIMLDNMSLAQMRQAVTLIRQKSSRTKIEASGNITLETLRAVAETGVDYISTSATITQAPWLDFSLRFLPKS
ncbi:MAG: carboxylating nicotinate-nucleotide diphosphorylase [Thermosynechococcaceae cyanobacterium MS004]|nr:carboxylating nicotinate-nucleotide diphosphorylase [Thermosynechococcaceae cyanobacterium MS004]